MIDASPSLRHRIAVAAMLTAAAAGYVGVVSARHGPTPTVDTAPLTEVVTDLSHGDLSAAASNESLPNPPGYPLLAAPFVAALRPLIGSASWCPTGGQPPRGDLPAGQVPSPLANCGTADGPPPWYRSQAILGVLAWLALAVGALALLRAAGVATLGRIAALLAFLVVLPSASSALVQLYHPQDIVSLGFALGALDQALRRRWVVSGLLFGAAILSKQFAVLLLFPAVAAAPDGRSRFRLVMATGVVFASGLLPFLVAAPHATVDNLSGVSGGGALSGATVLSELGATGNVASAVARDAPVVFAVGACLWAWRRWGRELARPELLLALSLACVGSRLVFESVLFAYYLLATSVVFFLLDLVARRWPHRSLVWCAASAFFVALRPGNRWIDAIGTLVLAVTGVLAGLAELRTNAARPAQPAALSRQAVLGEPGRPD